MTNAAMGTDLCECFRGLGATKIGGWAGRLLRLQELPGLLDVQATISMSQESEVADSDKAGRQHVLKESPDEFLGIQGHLADLLGAVVTITEGDFAISDVGEPVVGDGNSVGVPAEVVEDLLWASERLLGVDDPFFALGLVDKGCVTTRISQLREITIEVEALLLVGREQTREEDLAEMASENTDWQKESFRAADPLLPG